MYYSQCENCKKQAFILRKCSICSSWVCDKCFILDKAYYYGICGKCYRMSHIEQPKGNIRKDMWLYSTP